VSSSSIPLTAELYYRNKSLSLCQVNYESFFGLSENPFALTPDPRYLHRTRHAHELLRQLTRGITARKGLILLTGSVGTGKTTLLNTALHLLKQSSGGRSATRTAVLVHPTLTREEFSEAILAGFHILFMATRKTQRCQLLRDMLFDVQRKGGFAILAIDEAQLLTPELLDEIRVLRAMQSGSGELLQIILCGQPDLEEKLSRSSLSQLQPAITVRCETAPLTCQETRDYIRHRLIVAGAKSDAIFPGEAADAIHFHARGIPRVVNLLCAQALATAGQRGIRRVTPQIADEAAAKLLFNGLNPPRRRLRGVQADSAAIPPLEPQAQSESAPFEPMPHSLPLLPAPPSVSVESPSTPRPIVFAPKPVVRTSPIHWHPPSIRAGWERFGRFWSGNLARKRYWLFFFSLFLAGTLLLTLAQVALSQAPELHAKRATCGFLGLLLLDSSLGVAAYLYVDERRLRLTASPASPPILIRARRVRRVNINVNMKRAVPPPPKFVRMPGDRRTSRSARRPHKALAQPLAR
jgi:general secretion pathway protein A